MAGLRILPTERGASLVELRVRLRGRRRAGNGLDPGTLGGRLAVECQWHSRGGGDHDAPPTAGQRAVEAAEPTGAAGADLRRLRARRSRTVPRGYAPGGSDAVAARIALTSNGEAEGCFARMSAA